MINFVVNIFFISNNLLSANFVLTTHKTANNREHKNNNVKDNQFTSIFIYIYMCVCGCVGVRMSMLIPSLRYMQDTTQLVFKRSTFGLNSDGSFSKTGCLI